MGTAKGTKSLLAMGALAATGLIGQARTAHLTPDQIVQAWKSDAYRMSLTKEQQEALPDNPAGQVQLRYHGTTSTLEDLLAKGTCDHGCPCSTASMDCSGTAAMDCSGTAAMDCSNTSAMDCCTTGCMGCS